jgi:tetratricopeptide (TPR) repeat protein
MAVAAALLVGLAVTVVLLVTHAIEMQEEQKKTKGALEQAQENLERADQNLERADQNLDLALEALDKVYMTREPKDQNRIRWDKRMAEAERQSLQRGLQFYERFAQQNAGHEKLRQATARAYERAGNLRQELGDWTEAQADFAKAIEIFEKLIDEGHGRVEVQFELAQSYRGMTSSLQNTGQHGEAERMCRRAMALYEKLDAEYKVSFDPTEAKVGYRLYRDRMGQCLSELSQILFSTQQDDKAYEALRQALRLYEGLVAEHPTEPFSRPGAGGFNPEKGPPQATYANQLGHTARVLSFSLPEDRMQEKLALLQKAADVFRKLLTLPFSMWRA